MHRTVACAWLSGIALACFLFPCALVAKDAEKKKEAEKKSEKDTPAAEDADGLHKGLVAHYFKDPLEWDGQWKTGQKPTAEAYRFTFHEYSYSRMEPLINHLTVRRGWFSIRWVGYLKIQPGQSDQEKEGGENKEQEGNGAKKGGDAEAQEFTLELWMDDGARLFVDGEKLVDDWVPCAEDTLESHRFAQVRLAPGIHRLVVEYFQGESLPQHDPDPAKFYWSCPALKIPRQIVPASHFFHKAADLQDYVPSQGLSAGDKKKLKGGKELATPQPVQLQSWAAVADH